MSAPVDEQAPSLCCERCTRPLREHNGVRRCGWCGWEPPGQDAAETETRWAIQDMATSLRYRRAFPHWTADDDEAATFTEAEANEARRRIGRNGKRVRVVVAR